MARIVLIGIILFVTVSLLWSSLRKLLEEVRRAGGRGPDQAKPPEGIGRWFEILGVKPGASREEVNEAYRDLVKVWHPDRFSGNERLQRKGGERLKEINAAYEYLRSFYRWK